MPVVLRQPRKVPSPRSPLTTHRREASGRSWCFPRIQLTSTAALLASHLWVLLTHGVLPLLHTKEVNHLVA